MPGTIERRMKSRIQQRKRRNTQKGSVLLKSLHSKQNKSMKNLFNDKDINTNKDFNKPLKVLEKRRLADFIRKLDKISNKDKNNERNTNELIKLIDKRKDLMIDLTYIIIGLKDLEDGGLTVSQYTDLVNNVDNIFNEIEEANKRITELTKDIYG
jgi:hypothetical protein